MKIAKPGKEEGTYLYWSRCLRLDFRAAIPNYLLLHRLAEWSLAFTALTNIAFAFSSNDLRNVDVQMSSRRRVDAFERPHATDR